MSAPQQPGGRVPTARPRHRGSSHDLGSINPTIACRDSDTRKRLEPHAGKYLGAPSIDLRDPALRVAWNT
ncbi:hypothetical protein [Propionibacterium australiense]|uniref:Uncharacterized protein n=1 Tax=Propionibacterium australiense TaxID=119981 RepID=A0A383S7Z8_9ACTN|nr:hypothetical protein [Propionibacterium australiense]RLP06745.1 hypothetical protein D7U36_12310 [Propionibacterium australiense]RLP07495.1 hypothetical protein D9T14_10275 [Propionibacterium australiense]SYZ34098.1 Hypothetical protein PROPAUS_2100 [Propionibacterium australiense]VEH88687.1 Uncharacterised protein [Propionibacterium australiense]